MDVRIDGATASGSIRVDAADAFSLLFGVSLPLSAPELFILDQPAPG